MADQTLSTGGIFEDGENLQAAIGKALQEQKALLCFVYDEDDSDSDQWQAALLEESIREKLQLTTVLLRLKQGTDQAGFLSGVCPIQGVPAIVIIHNAQVVANYQNGQTSFEDLQKELRAKYAQTEDQQPSSSSGDTKNIAHLDLPPPEGRMRLPNNAYDELRKLTQDSISKGLTGKKLLELQLSTIETLKIDIVTKAVNDIRQNLETIPGPTLPDDVTDKLLNTPASRLKSTNSSSEGTSYGQGSSASSPRVQSSLPESHTPSTQTSRSPPTSLSRNATSNQSQPSTQSQPAPSTSTTPTTSSHTSQRSQYIAAQKARETAQADKRARIKAQAAAEKAVRREAEAQAAAEQRRIDLLNLRKANSTTSDPKASDVRIQVRLFDGSTIRNSFPAEATVAQEVRRWIDGEVTKKAAGGGSPAGQPYNLKLILTPLPTRAIEAGEEDQAICDLDGVKGSATMVMVPVRGYVDSYSGSSGGVVGGVVGGATSVLGAGIGLVGSAAGMFVGGLGRLMGGGAAPAPQPQRLAQEAPARGGGEETTSGGGRQNVRVRTLADQRMDEEDDRRRKGTQLYNGMGLNVQPRKDDDGDESK